MISNCGSSPFARNPAIWSKTNQPLRPNFYGMASSRGGIARATFISESSLDKDWEAFGHDLLEAWQLVLRLYGGLERSRITPAKSRQEIASLFDEPLPDEPQAMEAILREVEAKIVANSTLCLSPRFFGYINGSGNQAAIVGDLLASAMNQICAKWHFSPAASEVERRVIQWIAEFIGYPRDAAGCLLSGGSAGNLVGLAAARKHQAPFNTAPRGARGQPPLTVYVSHEGHASLDKNMAILGMGRDQLRRIKVKEDFTINLECLEEQIARDRGNGYVPICVVGNAGTTNTGAVDPLDCMAEFCRRQQLWFHVDAAYGGPAASTKSAGGLFRGLEKADSIVVNPHKWLYVPVEVGCILVRRPQALRETFEIMADYLQESKERQERSDTRLDYKDYSPQLTRGFRALKVWMTFKAYGASKLRAAIESNIAIMRYLGQLIDQADDFVRLAPVTLSAVCFQYRTADRSLHQDQEYLDGLNQRLLDALEKDGRVFLSGTKIHGKSALRACSINHRLCREHIHLLMDVIREVASTVANLL